MSPMTALIDDILRRGLAGLMKQQGFKKSARYWHREQAHTCLIANVQASLGNSASEARFTVNLAVYAPSIAQLAGQAPPQGPPKEYEAALRTRLGRLAYGKDHWWVVTPLSDPQAVAVDLADTMQAFGLPWLYAQQEIESLSEALKDTDSLTSVCAAWAAGQREEAERRLRAALAAKPAAQAHFRAWAAKMGIAL